MSEAVRSMHLAVEVARGLERTLLFDHHTGYALLHVGSLVLIVEWWREQ